MLEATPTRIHHVHEGVAPPAADAGARRSPWRWLVWLLLLAGVSAAGYATVARIQALKAESVKKAPPPRVIPVVTATAEKRDLGLYLSGLGTVTAFNTVTIRSRVAGELIRVAFEEGQIVEPGQLLAEIDPRHYEVQLEQAEGQLAKDQAALKNAQLDLARS
ncbi:MAG: biotin/lipoyl-binding protein, partial [Planctomycetaceae bacterium]|nr:biotin/lipoyl-binding protein [Planctomycetaceae bacterium]